MEFDLKSTLNNINISTPQSAKSLVNIFVTDNSTEECHQKNMIKSGNSSYVPLEFLNSSAALKKGLFDQENQQQMFSELSMLQQISFNKFEHQSYILIPIQADVASGMQLNSYDVFPAIFEHSNNEYILPAFFYPQ